MLNAGSYTQKGKYCLVLICKVRRISKFTETESRMVVARGGELALSRTEFPFGMMKKFWGWMDGVDGCVTM